MMAFRVLVAFAGLIAGGIFAALYATTQWHEAKEGVEPATSYLLGLGGICFGTLVFFTVVLTL